MKYDYEEPFKEALAKITDNNLKRKLVAIRKLVVDRMNLENEFKKEHNILDAKYEALYQPFYEKRTQIIEGSLMPNIEEIKDKLKELNVESEAVLPQTEKGVPSFWLKALENAKSIIELNEKDKEVLKHLTNIKCQSKVNGDFTLQFFFEPNEYFEHPMLERQYILNAEFEVKLMKSTEIAWKSDETNPTIEIKKKKMKNKKTKEIKTITKKEDVPSFFTSFRNMEKKDDDDKKKKDDDEDDDDDDENEEELTIDEEYDIALEFKEEIIPFAIEYYLGVADDDDDFDEEEEEEDDDDDDEDDEEDVKPHKGGNKKGHTKHGKH